MARLSKLKLEVFKTGTGTDGCMSAAISTQVIDGTYGVEAAGMSVRLLEQTMNGSCDQADERHRQ